MTTLLRSLPPPSLSSFRRAAAINTSRTATHGHGRFNRNRNYDNIHTVAAALRPLSISQSTTTRSSTTATTPSLSYRHGGYNHIPHHRHQRLLHNPRARLISSSSPYFYTSTSASTNAAFTTKRKEAAKRGHAARKTSNNNRSSTSSSSTTSDGRNNRSGSNSRRRRSSSNTNNSGTRSRIMTSASPSSPSPALSPTSSPTPSTSESLIEEWNDSVKFPTTYPSSESHIDSSSSWPSTRRRNNDENKRVGERVENDEGRRARGGGGSNQQLKMRRRRQHERLSAKKQEFSSLIDKYQSIWYPNTKSSSSPSPSSSSFRSSLKFEHPPFPVETEEYHHYQQQKRDSNDDGLATPTRTSTTYSIDTATLWTKIVESEDTFRQICTVNHDLFVASSSLSESLDPTSVESDNSTLTTWQQHNRNFDEFLGQDFVMASILPFWEKLRREREEIVQLCRPASGDENCANSDLHDHSGEKTGSWSGGFVQSFLKVIGLSSSLSGSSSYLYRPITAHSDPDCAPNGYHYAKLMGNIYFRYWPLIRYQQQTKGVRPSERDENLPIDDSIVEDNQFISNNDDASNELVEILNQRSKRLQELVDHCPPSSDVLSSKNLRLLLRSYHDTGTMEAAKKAEAAYNRFPGLRSNGNLWYVLLTLISVISNDEKNMRRQASEKTTNNWSVLFTVNNEMSTEDMVTAARRICEILSSMHSRNPSDFQSRAHLGFQGLRHINPSSMDGYYDRVHSLAILKFGPKTWDALVNDQAAMEDLKDVLHPKDYVSIHSLVLIYAKDYERIDRAMRLLDVAFNNFSVNDLENSFRRSTFSFLLNKLKKRKHMRLKAENRDGTTTSRNPELDMGLAIMDKMRLHDDWFPNSSTFHDLFRLCDGGQDADRVLAALEVCRGISSLKEKKYGSGMNDNPSSSYEIMPLLTPVRYALNEWTETATRLELMNDTERASLIDPALRAFDLFRSAQAIGSTPLLLSQDRLSNLYYSDCEVDESIYSLALRVCSRSAKYSDHALDVALRIKDIAEREGMLMEGSICFSLFKCISNTPDVNKRVVLTKDLLQTAMSTEPDLKRSMVTYLLTQFSYYKHKQPYLYDQHLRDLDFEKKFGHINKQNKSNND